jgi:hypothetical protein
MFINNCKHGADCPLDLDAPNNRSKIENVAFSAYAKHSQECEDIINLVLDKVARGEAGAFTLELDDDFSDADIAYIEAEIERRIGG